ncbi:MAG: ribosome maturation factor RimM [Actinobacteria bacterium]|nr:ribosome maturation factor RimM [Actinomycetota bacterium]
MQDYVTIGQILKPRGTRGEVDLLSLTDFPDRFHPGLRVYLIPPLPDRRELVIEEVAHQPKGLVLTFEGVETRNDVEPLRGRYIAVPPGEVEELPEGAYWIDDLIGLTVVTTAGERIGRVKDVLRSAGNDVYVVEDDQGEEHLIPAIRDVVKKIDLNAGKITIEPMPGLFD